MKCQKQNQLSGVITYVSDKYDLQTITKLWELTRDAHCSPVNNKLKYCRYKDV